MKIDAFAVINRHLHKIWDTLRLPSPQEAILLNLAATYDIYPYELDTLATYWVHGWDYYAYLQVGTRQATAILTPYSAASNGLTSKPEGDLYLARAVRAF